MRGESIFILVQFKYFLFFKLASNNEVNYKVTLHVCEGAEQMELDLPVVLLVESTARLGPDPSHVLTVIIQACVLCVCVCVCGNF